MKNYDFFGLPSSEQVDILLSKIQSLFKENTSIVFKSHTQPHSKKTTCTYTFGIGDYNFYAYYYNDTSQIDLQSLNHSVYSYFKIDCPKELITSNLHKVIDTYGLDSIMEPVIVNNEKIYIKYSRIRTFLNDDEFVYFASFVINNQVVNISKAISENESFEIRYRIKNKKSYCKVIKGDNLYDLLEICIYDIYLKNKHGFGRRTKNNLKIAEMFGY